jgi:hypothetical protein
MKRVARGSVVGWGNMLQAGSSLVRVPDEVDFLNLSNPSSSTMALGSTQPLTEMSTRNFPGGKTLPPSMSRMSENVGASTPRNPKGLHGLYRENFTLTTWGTHFLCECRALFMLLANPQPALFMQYAWHKCWRSCLVIMINLLTGNRLSV